MLLGFESLKLFVKNGVIRYLCGLGLVLRFYGRKFRGRGVCRRFLRSQ